MHVTIVVDGAPVVVDVVKEPVLRGYKATADGVELGIVSRKLNGFWQAQDPKRVVRSPATGFPTRGEALVFLHRRAWRGGKDAR